MKLIFIISVATILLALIVAAMRKTIAKEKDIKRETKKRMQDYDNEVYW